MHQDQFTLDPGAIEIGGPNGDPGFVTTIAGLTARTAAYFLGMAWIPVCKAVTFAGTKPPSYRVTCLKTSLW